MFSIFRSLQPAGFETTVGSSEASFFVFDVVVTWSTAKTPAGGVFVRVTTTWSISNPRKGQDKKNCLCFETQYLAVFNWFQKYETSVLAKIEKLSTLFFLSQVVISTPEEKGGKKKQFTVSPFIARASNCSHLCALFFSASGQTTASFRLELTGE